MISVLHVTPHLGGGVGRVLLNHFAYINPQGTEKHSIACLEDANAASVAKASLTGIPLTDMMADNIPELLKMMGQSDIVVVHWWNYPLLYSFFMNLQLPPVRLLIWSHVAGCFPTQNFTDEIVAYPDFFVLATRHSLEAPAICRLSEKERKARIRIVFTCAGIEHVAEAEPEIHDGFRIGYVGTVDYCKIHQNVIKMSMATNIPEARFIFCGGSNEAALRNDAVSAGAGGRFEFTGLIDNVPKMLSSFDIFGYPLAPDHYGTGEQALIEALAVGIPPVVLANGAEQHIVQDAVTGIVAKSEAEYSEALELLYRDPEKRLFLGENARRHARANFTIEKLADSWSKLYEEALRLPKAPKAWPALIAGRPVSGSEAFLASLGEHGGEYKASMSADNVSEACQRIANAAPLFKSKTRGSVFHYQRFFPDDPYLNYWCGLISQAEGDCEMAEMFFKAANFPESSACYLNNQKNTF